MLVALLAVLAALPGAAEIYTVTLTNGSLFESRYQPRQAAWDEGMMELATETGLWIAMPKSLVQSVTAMSETKGFGRVIDTTTIDLGFAPNDLPEEMDPAGRLLRRAAGVAEPLVRHPAVRRALAGGKQLRRRRDPGLELRRWTGHLRGPDAGAGAPSRSGASAAGDPGTAGHRLAAVDLASGLDLAFGPT